MKKQLILILITTISTFVNVIAQDKIVSYNSSYFSKNYDVSATKPDAKGIYTYYIDCYSRDTSSKQVSLILKSNEVPEIVEYLNSLKETFSKWSLTAKENKVTELDKNVEYKKLTYGAAFSYGKWNFDFSVNLSARFKIIDNKYLMIIDSDELQSSSNQFIKSSGFRFVFSAIEEIDEFIKCLDDTKVQSFFNSKNSKEDLFKN